MTTKFYAYVLLLAFSYSGVMATQNLDVKQFETSLKRAPYNEIHQSDCLVKRYEKGKVTGSANATYMLDLKTNKRFIVTTSHLLTSSLQSAQQFIVTFDGIEEYCLEGFTPVITDIYSERFQRNNLQNDFQTSLGCDIAIGFIPGFNKPIKPARFSTLPIDQIRDLPCSLAGYGMLIDEDSTKDMLIINVNEKKIKTLMTLKVSYHADSVNQFLASHGIFLGAQFISTYQKPGTQNATSYEQPLRPGFSGASLRDEKGYVIGIASHGAPGPITDDFKSRHPNWTKLFYKAHDFIQRYPNPKYYSLSVLAVGGYISAYVLGNTWMGYMGLGLVSYMSYQASYIPLWENVCWNDYKYPGTKSYFSATAPHKDQISKLVEEYWQNYSSNKTI